MTDFVMPKHIVAVSGLVRNAVGEVLLVRSPKRGWEIPGGQVEEGETLPDALMREIQEEAGVMVTVGALAGLYSNVKPPPKVIFAFLCEYLSGEVTISDESLETAWVGANDVLSRITHPAMVERTQDLLSFTGQVIYRVYTTDPYEMLDKREI